MTLLEIEAQAEAGNKGAQALLRLLTLSRDLYRCQDCGEDAEEVHHIISRRYRGAWDIRNMISLCKEHHELCDKGAGAHTHEKRKMHLRLLREKYGYSYTEPLYLSALEEMS